MCGFCTTFLVLDRFQAAGLQGYKFHRTEPDQLWAECLRPSGEIKACRQHAKNKRAFDSKESASFAQLCFVVTASTDKATNAFA